MKCVKILKSAIRDVVCVCSTCHYVFVFVVPVTAAFDRTLQVLGAAADGKSRLEAIHSPDL